MLLCFRAEGFAATGSSNSQQQWRRPRVVRRVVPARENVRPAQELRSPRVFRDAHVMSAAWEENDALAAHSTPGEMLAEERSVVVEKSASDYDPFDEDDRLAFLPEDPLEDDPFDEPVGESIPEPTENIEAVEDAIEQEIRRRELEDDQPDEQMEDLLDSDPLVEEPLEEPDELDPLYDDLDDEEEDLLQPKSDDLSTPDPDLNPYPDDQEDRLTAEDLLERSEEFQQERRESEGNCREELEEVEADKISSIDLSIRVKGNAGEDFPYECDVSTNTHQPRQWSQITYNWKAAALCHKPLYFEQVQLERYGHSWGPYVQPIMSGVHFFGTLPVLPYKMGIRTPTECVYTLGYYRPGSCAPYMIDPIPFTWRAALFEGAAVTGISYVIP